MFNQIIRISLIILGLIVYSSGLHARGHVFEVAYQQVQMDIGHQNGSRFRAIPTVLVGKYAFRFNKYVALEGSFGLGLARDDYAPAFMVRESVKVESIASAGAVAYYPLSKAVSIFANLGFSSIIVSLTRSGDFNRTDKLTDTGVNYGAGFLFDFTPTQSIIIKYGYLPKVKLRDGGSIESNTFDIAYQKRF